MLSIASLAVTFLGLPVYIAMQKRKAAGADGAEANGSETREAVKATR
jgi:hypothetical protein